MSRRSLSLLLTDMIECIDKLAIVIEGLSYEEFRQDVKAFYAAVSLVSILGEAANQITKVSVSRVGNAHRSPPKMESILRLCFLILGAVMLF